VRVQPRILLVRHGRGRGRIEGYWNDAVAYLSRHRPRLRERIRLHHTGHPLPRLENVGAAVFWLGDPLADLYPECHEEARRIAARVERVVNPPGALSRTSKGRQACLWRAAGLPTPRGEPFGTREELKELLSAAQYPVLIRPDRLHASDRLHILRSEQEARALTVEKLALPGLLSPFVDVRAGYDYRNPGSIWSRLYHKKRVFVLGRHVVPRHLFFSTGPLVRAEDSTLAPCRNRCDRLLGLLPRGRHLDRRLHLRARCQRLHPLSREARASLRLEAAFVDAAPERPAMMRRAARLLGLEFAAVDYSTLADGRVILWEVNPYPWLNRWHTALLPYRRRMRERNERLYERLADFLEELTGAGRVPSVRADRPPRSAP